jgi:hypothetical protein
MVNIWKDVESLKQKKKLMTLVSYFSYPQVETIIADFRQYSDYILVLKEYQCTSV